MDLQLRSAHVMNNILRSAYKEPGKTNSWVLRDPTIDMHTGDDSALEWDHFFEIQHIVALLFGGYYGDKPILTEDPARAANPDFFMNHPLGEFLCLATFVNDLRNLYQVDKQFNATKKFIPLLDYFPTRNSGYHHERSSAIQEYLNCQCNPGALLKRNQKWEKAKKLPLSSVEANLVALVKDMVNYNGADGALAREIGDRLAFHMGWKTFREGWIV